MKIVPTPSNKLALEAVQERLKNFLKANHMEAEFWQAQEEWHVACALEHRVISEKPDAPVDQRFERRETFPGARGFNLILSMSAAPVPPTHSVVNDASGKLLHRRKDGSLPRLDGQWLAYDLDSGSALDDRFVQSLLDCLHDK